MDLRWVRAERKGGNAGSSQPAPRGVVSPACAFPLRDLGVTLWIWFLWESWGFPRGFSELLRDDSPTPALDFNFFLVLTPVIRRLAFSRDSLVFVFFFVLSLRLVGNVNSRNV